MFSKAFSWMQTNTKKQTVFPEIFNLKNFSSKKFYVDTNPNWVQNNISVNTSQ